MKYKRGSLALVVAVLLCSFMSMVTAGAASASTSGACVVTDIQLNGTAPATVTCVQRAGVSPLVEPVACGQAGSGQNLAIKTDIGSEYCFSKTGYTPVDISNPVQYQANDMGWVRIYPAAEFFNLNASGIKWDDFPVEQTLITQICDGCGKHA